MEATQDHATDEAEPVAPDVIYLPPVDAATILAALDRIEAKVDHVLTFATSVGDLVEQAGPALEELAKVAEAVQSGGIMALLKPGKAKA